MTCLWSWSLMIAFALPNGEPLMLPFKRKVSLNNVVNVSDQVDGNEVISQRT
jgi:hypothetical protein